MEDRQERLPAEAAFKLLGEGWTGDEAVAIAIWAALSSDSYIEAIKKAANHSGDSDSTASIAGQIWGTFGSLDCPVEWMSGLDVYRQIRRLVPMLEPRYHLSSFKRCQSLFL